MLETSFPSFPGSDCPSERTGRTVHRQFTIEFLFMTLRGRWVKQNIASKPCFFWFSPQQHLTNLFGALRT